MYTEYTCPICKRSIKQHPSIGASPECSGCNVTTIMKPSSCGLIIPKGKVHKFYPQLKD